MTNPPGKTAVTLLAASWPERLSGRCDGLLATAATVTGYQRATRCQWAMAEVEPS